MKSYIINCIIQLHIFSDEIRYRICKLVPQWRQMDKWWLHLKITPINRWHLSPATVSATRFCAASFSGASASSMFLYSLRWLCWRWYRKLVVLPVYFSTFAHTLQWTDVRVFLSGSTNFPSCDGNPKYFQTALLQLSSGHNSIFEDVEEAWDDSSLPLNHRCD